ncbi:sucrase-isomaltase, intestinal [Trichonephila clavipes]|nr:sucrase-isomaltase, intestinal [Trichonephila clavipes]
MHHGRVRKLSAFYIQSTWSEAGTNFRPAFRAGKMPGGRVNGSKADAIQDFASNFRPYVTLLPAPGITFRTIGGVIDLFFILGRDPENLVQLYTDLIGKPTIPPYWSLGFQLSRYGYNSLENLKNAVERTRDAGIAQDVQFLDIDHMEGNRDFTYDTKRFNGLIEYINKTREAYGLKWIIILDPAIEAVKDYSVYESGLQNDVFIKRSSIWKEDMFPEELRKNNVTYGKVWPETHVAFPNFLDDKTKNWWINTIVDYHKKLPFDGLWIDMNEPSNFGTNEEKPFYCENKPNCWSLKCPNSPYDDPPYNPSYDGLKAVTHHVEAKKHKECESAAAMSHRMKSFFTPKGSFCIVGKRHHISYIAQDCSLKVLKQVINDSDIVKQMTGGRTKCTVNQVLRILWNLCKDLKNDVPFSVATDASNIKLFESRMRKIAHAGSTA